MPPIAEPGGTKTPPRRRSYAFPLLLVLVAGASGAVWFLGLPDETAEAPTVPESSADTAARVHVVSPQPTTFHRWFDVPGVVTPGQDDTLSFGAAGRIQEVLPPGTTFVAGEIIGRLYGAPERELAVNRLRSRVAFYEQLRDTSRAEGAEVAAQMAEAKLAARRQELAAAQAALAQMQIRPRVPGTIAQLLVAKTAIVKPGTPVFLVRSAGPRAIFPLSVEDAARARALGFCRVETVPGTGGGAATTGGGGSVGNVGGGGSGGSVGNVGNVGLETGTRAIDCAVAAAATGGAPESRLAVDLVGAAGVTPGTQVRLASARYDGVFPVPRSALVREGNVDHVWVVSGGGRFAERRTVETVGTVDELGLVAHGIAVGDAVIVDPPATLKGGAEISVAP